MAELRSFGEEIHFHEGVPPADPEPLDVPASAVAPQRESKGLDTDEEENRVGHRIVIGSFPDFLSDVEPRTRRPGARPSGRAGQDFGADRHGRARPPFGLPATMRCHTFRAT